MDILIQLYWFCLTISALIVPVLIIYNFFSIVAFLQKYWPRPSEQDDDERKGNTLLAKRIAFCAVPVIVFFALVSAVRLAVLLISPPDAPSLLGGGVDFRVHYLAFVGLATFLVALIGLPFALFRYEALERQTLAQEEGLTTDRINKAVEGLGAEKTRKKSATNSEGESRSLEETLPNLEVRIGAIYALERIAQDSLRDHIQIMEILCAYIRQNAPASEAPELPKPPEWFSMMGDNGLLWRLIFNAWSQKHREALNEVKPRADIQTALTVIGRRTDRQIAKEWGSKERYERFKKGPPKFPDFEADESGAPTQAWRDAVGSWVNEFGEWKRLKPAYRLDLRETDLSKTDMSGQSQQADFSHGRFERADLQGVNFREAKAQGANFWFAKAQGADFWFAKAQGADFWFAKAQGANFRAANAQGADFRAANAQGANFREAKAQGANFWFANAQGANFWFAKAQGADFWFAKAQGADFWEANAQGANFREAKAQGANFREANAQGANFRDTTFNEETEFSASKFLLLALKSDISMVSLTQEQVNAAFGDGYTAHHLPAGLSKPDHWPDWDMDPLRFHEEWRIWQREGDAYVPPPKPAE